MKAWISCVALLALWALGCGDSTSPPLDAATDPSDAGVTEAWPTPPALPDFGPCPEGWREVEVASGVVVCDPSGPGGPMECPLGEGHFTGTPGCAALRTACPEGEWPTNADAIGTTHYVRPGASGAGSREEPFGSIRAALAVAGPGDVVLLAKATFDEGPLVVGEGVTLRGACAAETAIAPLGEFAGPIINVTDARNVRFEDLRIGPTLNSGPLFKNAEATLVGVELVGLYLVGMAADASEVTLERVAIRGSQTESASGDLGFGVLAVRGAEVTIKESLLERNARGLRAETNAHVRVEDTAARWTHGWFALGPGFEAALGGRIELVRTECTESRGACINTNQESEIVFDQVVLRGVLGQESNGAFGYGVAARQSTLSGGRVWVDHARRTGIAIWDSRVSLTDVVVSDTQRNEALEEFAIGVACGVGASCDLHRAWLSDNGTVGVLLFDDVTSILEDLTIIDTQELGGIGIGLLANESASLTLRRSRIEGNSHVGVMLAGGGESRLEATLEDVVVRGTRASSEDGTLGRGLLTGRGASTNIQRMLIEGNREVALSLPRAQARF